MFTGIIEERGEVLDLSLAADGDSARLSIRADTVTGDVGHGDSIAVSGVCLTVVERAAGSFTADVMAETLSRTTLGSLAVGDEVNLERSVLPTTRMGGHVVQGHVDGVGTLVSRTPHPAWDEIRIAVGARAGPLHRRQGRDRGRRHLAHRRRRARHRRRRRVRHRRDPGDPRGHHAGRPATAATGSTSRWT